MSQSQLLDAIKRSQEVAGFYQAQDERKAEALRLLKGQLIQQHQATLFHSNTPRFAVLRQQIYQHFRDVTFPGWDPDRYPHGVYWMNAFLGFLQDEDLVDANLDGATYRRRLNELADKRVTNPPLLAWTRPGFYVLAKLEGS